MPDTFQGFLSWLLTAGGLSIVTAVVIGAIIRVAGPDLPDLTKRIIALIVPFVLVILAALLQAALNFVPWNIDSFYQGIVLAIELVAGSQGAYQMLYKVIRP